jgi:cob(I)alamin adenosyltransferase
LISLVLSKYNTEELNNKLYNLNNDLFLLFNRFKSNDKILDNYLYIYEHTLHRRCPRLSNYKKEYKYKYVLFWIVYLIRNYANNFKSKNVIKFFECFRNITSSGADGAQLFTLL